MLFRAVLTTPLAQNPGWTVSFENIVIETPICKTYCPLVYLQCFTEIETVSFALYAIW